MTPQEQQALSLKYSNRVAIVLRLDDGTYAVFTNQRRLVCFSPSAETMALAVDNIEKWISPNERKPRFLDQETVGLSLEDLGL